jgi:cytochrome c biogenesis protein CcdA/tetratricopeptide (TPR) repeat protein
MSLPPKLGLTFALALAWLWPTASPAEAASEQQIVFGEALRTARDLSDPGRRASALIYVVEGYVQADLPDEARALIRSMPADAWRGSLSSLRVCSLAELAMEAEAVDLALQIAGAGGDEQAVDVLVALAAARLDALRPEQARAAVNAARDRIKLVQSPARRLELRLAVALCEQRLGDRGQAAAMITEALADAAEIRDEGLDERVVADLMDAAAEAGLLDRACGMIDLVRGDGQKSIILAQVSGLYAAAGDSAKSAEFRQRADQVGRNVAADWKALTALDWATHFSRKGRTALSVELVSQARRDAEQIRNREARITTLQQISMRYGDLGMWEEAARAAADRGDQAMRCKCLATVAVQRAADGKVEEALEIVNGLDPDQLLGVGYQRLQELARIYHDGHPGATPADVLTLRPQLLQELVLGECALSAARRGDHRAALDWSKRIKSSGRRSRSVLAAIEESLETARSDQAEAALATAREGLDLFKYAGEKLHLLFQMGRKLAAEGDTAAVDGIVRQMEQLVEEREDELEEHGEPDEVTTAGKAQIGVLLELTGHKAEAVKRVREAVEDTESIHCFSCLWQAATDILAAILAGGNPSLLEAALGASEDSMFQVSKWIELSRGEGLNESQRALLLREALQEASGLRKSQMRVQLLSQVAVAYAAAGVEPGEAERRLIEAAAARIDKIPESPAQATAEALRGTSNLVFFTRGGCDGCAEAKEAVQKAAERFPNIDVKVEYCDLRDSEHWAEINIRMAETTGVTRLLVPAVFTVNEGLAGKDVTEDAVAALIARGIGLPQPTLVYGRDDLGGSLLRRDYEALKPAVVVSAGLADGVNPCAFSVIIFFLSYLAYMGRSRRQIVAAGIVFTVAVFVTYYAIGLGLATLLDIGESWSAKFTLFVRLIIMGMLLVAAVLSLRDWVLCLKGRPGDMALALPDSVKSKIRQTIAQRARLGLTVAATAVLGAIVAMFEFPCTGQIYIPIVNMVRDPEYFWSAAGWLLVYNVFFIAPLLVIFTAVLLGVTSQKITALFRRHMAKTKLAMALVFVALFAVMATQVV